MSLTQSFIVALESLFTHKLRSTLTVLGIIIGVGAVIALMSIGRGTQAMVTERIESLGTNLIFVRPGRAADGRVQGAVGSAATLTLADAEALGKLGDASGIGRVAPEVRTMGQLVTQGRNTRAQILGVTPEYLEVMQNLRLAEGEFISAQHVAARSSVVVLGSNVAQTLFPDTSPLGQSLRINQNQLRVIGVLERMGGTGFFSMDEQVLAPITTVQTRLQMQRNLQGQPHVSTINVQVAQGQDIDKAMEEISVVLRELHRITGEDDFVLSSQRDILQAFEQVTMAITAFLGSIAGISLLVGGIGIMNIMLVSVTERTREIGIRKAVGAKRRDILLQFLVEATVLSLSGGLLGILLGWGVSRLISGQNIGGQALRTVVSPEIVVLAAAVSVAVGLFFGIYPAVRASRLNPIEALHYE